MPNHEPEALRKIRSGWLSAHRHTMLLIAIVVTFAVRPFFGEGRTALIAFSIALLVLLLVALSTTQVDELIGERAVLLRQRRRRGLIALLLGLVALGERLYSFVHPSAQLLTVSTVCWLLFFIFITVSQFRALLKHREVTGETISMAVSVYLLLGLSWGMLYIVMFQRHRDAFSLAATPGATTDPQGIFPVFIYFSLTTLSTIGFGDILPLSLPARYAAVAEGITGQFYLAILVARLVGMQMSRAAGPSTGAPADEP